MRQTPTDHCPPYVPGLNEAEAILELGTVPMLFDNGSYAASIDGEFSGTDADVDFELLVAGDVRATAQDGPRQAGSAQPEPAPPGVAGREALRAGELELALRLLREHVEQHADDWATRRLIGFALIESGRVADGAALVHVTYVEAPELAAEPLDVGLFANTDTRSRRLQGVIRDVARRAHRTNLASGWVVLTASMQARERPRIARKHLDRAEQAGLEPAVVEAFRKALEG